MLGLSTSYFATTGKGIYDSVKRINELGFECAELGAAHSFEAGVWETLKRIKADFPRMKFTVHGLFPPQQERFWFNACEGLTKKNMDAVDNLIKAARIVGADVVGIHPGYPAVLRHSGVKQGFDNPILQCEIPIEKALENSREVIEFGLIAAEDNGIKFAVENAGLCTPSDLFLHPKNIKLLLDAYPELCFLLDLGHALYMRNLDAMLEFHERISEMHLHFSPPRSGSEPDKHLPIPEGFDFAPLSAIKQIREIPLVFEHTESVSEAEIKAEKALLENFLKRQAAP